jgi:DNA-binding FrmR family transcriptional regulator
MEHQSHPAIIKRLKRAEGHLRSLIGMIEAGKPCLDLAQQLHAVENAIANAKRELIHDHIDHCLDGAVNSNGKSARAALAEFKALSKYL